MLADKSEMSSNELEMAQNLNYMQGMTHWNKMQLLSGLVCIFLKLSPSENKLIKHHEPFLKFVIIPKHHMDHFWSLLSFGKFIATRKHYGPFLKVCYHLDTS